MAMTQSNISCLAKTQAKHYFACNLDNSFIWLAYFNYSLLETQRLVLPAHVNTPNGTLAFLHDMVLCLSSFPLRMCSFSMTLFTCDTELGQHLKSHHSITYIQENNPSLYLFYKKKVSLFFPSG